MMEHGPIVTLIKGMVVGGTMLVPGVSGGSMALILGIYHQLVSAVSSFMKDKKAHLIFLGLFALGGGIGALLFAKPIGYLIEEYPMPMLYLFLGAVAGGMPLLFKQAAVKSFSWKTIVYIIIGIGVVMLIGMLPEGMLQPGASNGMMYYLILVVAGIIAAVALILPGISVSYLLLTMGIYDQMIQAISELEIAFLLPLGVGVLAGIILTTKLLESIMEHYPEPTYLVIIGFVLGSMAQVFPGIPIGIDLLICVGMFLAGFFAICRLSKKEC